MRQLRIGLAQLNVSVGDVEGNARRVLDEIERARALGVDLVAFPELCLTGYPPEDLLFKSAFIEANLRALDEVARASARPHRRRRLRRPARRHLQRRRRLPRRRAWPASTTSSTCRTTASSTRTATSRRGRRRRSSTLGEDGPFGGEHLRGHLVPDRAHDRAGAGRGRAGRHHQRARRTTPARCASARRCWPPARPTTSVYLAFVNLVGGQDELVFDGAVHGR